MCTCSKLMKEHKLATLWAACKPWTRTRPRTRWSPTPWRTPRTTCPSPSTPTRGTSPSSPFLAIRGSKFINSWILFLNLGLLLYWWGQILIYLYFMINKALLPWQCHSHFCPKSPHPWQEIDVWVGAGARCSHVAAISGWLLELETKLHEVFTIMEKAPFRAFHWLKVPTSPFTFMTLC